MKFAVVALLFFSACSFAKAQSFEASVSGGESILTNPVIGTDVFSSSPGPNAKARLTNGFRLTFRIGINLYNHFGTEFGYGYNRTQLQFDGPPVTQQGMAIHQGFADALAYATPEKARIRPFVAGGIQFSNFVPPGQSAQYGQGENKFGVNYGGGVKVRVSTSWQVRFDFRQYETGKPFSVPGASGRLLQNEVSVGVGFVL